MSLRERIEWVFRMGLLVFILAAAAFLSAVTAMRFAIQGREVSMPNLVGKSSLDAQAILQGRGLQLKVVDRVYSSLPANAVARQSPPEGERM
jgi:beta-lactam-binding protein with PASTA domain